MIFARHADRAGGAQLVDKGDVFRELALGTRLAIDARFEPQHVLLEPGRRRRRLRRCRGHVLVRGAELLEVAGRLLDAGRFRLVAKAVDCLHHGRRHRSYLGLTVMAGARPARSAPPRRDAAPP